MREELLASWSLGPQLKPLFIHRLKSHLGGRGSSERQNYISSSSSLGRSFYMSKRMDEKERGRWRKSLLWVKQGVLQQQKTASKDPREKRMGTSQFAPAPTARQAEKSRVPWVLMSTGMDRKTQQSNHSWQLPFNDSHSLFDEPLTHFLMVALGPGASDTVLTTAPAS